MTPRLGYHERPRLTTTPCLLLACILTLTDNVRAWPLPVLWTKRDSLAQSASPSVWTLTVVIFVIFVGLAALSCLGRALFRQSRATRIANVANEIEIELNRDVAGGAPRRPRRPRGHHRRPRRPSQISVTSLPEYREQPGDGELLVFRGQTPAAKGSQTATVVVDHLPDDEDPSQTRRYSERYFPIPTSHNTMPLLREQAQERGRVRVREYYEDGDDDTSGDLPMQLFTNGRPSTRNTTRQNLHLLAASSSTSTTLSSPGTNNNNDHTQVSTSTSIPPPAYYEVIGDNEPLRSSSSSVWLSSPSSSMSASSRAPLLAPSISRSTMASTSSTAPLIPEPARATPNCENYRPRTFISRISTPGSGGRNGNGHLRSPSSNSVYTNGSAAGRPSSSFFHRAGSSLSSSSHSRDQSHSSIASLSISAPLTYTASRTNFGFPQSSSTGLPTMTPQQVSVIAGKEAIGKFGVPFGVPSRVNRAPPSGLLYLVGGPPPPGFEDAVTEGSRVRSTRFDVGAQEELNYVRSPEEENAQGGLGSREDDHTSRSISGPDAVKSSSARLSAPVDVMNHLAETIGDIEALLHDIGINPNDVAFAAGFDEGIFESSGMLIQQAYILTRVALVGDEGQITRTLDAVGEILAPYSGVVSTPLRRYYLPTHLPSSGRCTFSEFISFHAKPMGVPLELLTREPLESIQNESDNTARSPSSTGSGNRSEGVQRGDQNRDKDRSGSQREVERDSRPPNDSASEGNDGDAEGSHSLQSMETNKVESPSMSLSHHVASGFPPDDNPLQSPDASSAVHFEVEFNIRHSEGKCMPHQTIRVEGTVQSEEIPEASLPHAMPHATLSSRIRFRRIDFYGNAGGTDVNERYRQSSAYIRIDVGKNQGRFQLFDVEPQCTTRQDSKMKQVEANEKTRQHQIDMSTIFTILPLPGISIRGNCGNTTAQKSGTTEESSVNINRIIQTRTGRDMSWHYSVDDKWVKEDGLRGLAPSASFSFLGTEKGCQKPDKLKIEVDSTWTMPNAGVWDRYSRIIRNIPIRTLATQVTFDIPPHMTTSWTVCRDMDVRIIPRDKGFGLKLQIESNDVYGGVQDFPRDFRAVISQMTEHYGDPHIAAY